MLPQKFSAATTRTVAGARLAVRDRAAAGEREDARAGDDRSQRRRRAPPYHKVRLSLITVMSREALALVIDGTDGVERARPRGALAGGTQARRRSRARHRAAGDDSRARSAPSRSRTRCVPAAARRAAPASTACSTCSSSTGWSSGVEVGDGQARFERSHPERRAPPPSRVRPLRAVGGVRRSGARAGDRSPVRASRRADRQPRRAAARRLRALRLKARYQVSTFGRRLPGRVHHSPGWSRSSVAIQRRLSAGSITSSISP